MPDQVSGILSPWLRKKRIKVALPYVKGKVLDYGCGAGTLIASLGMHSYFGVDIDEESLRVARRNYPLAQFAANYPENEIFDTIVLLAVIEHIAEPESFLIRIQRVLEPNGSIVITTPHPCAEKIHSWGTKIGLFSTSANEEHKKLYNHRCMQDIARRSGLIICEYKRFLFGVNQLFILRKK
ncbi:MAG: methyltransferase domain-containing protein [Thermodesulfovibrionales bacterium]|jgi:2-polyprenyl-3-methyl-5-hydroxy-6-metoxy-1,4-benzoquinol methylase|nr:methyltransferase domain-containing protein [Thermodesulfovibrionales bacterium]